MPLSVDYVITPLYTLIKKPWRVVDIMYELTFDSSGLCLLHRNKCRNNEEKLWVNSIQNYAYSRSSHPKRNKIKSEINMVKSAPD